MLLGRGAMPPRNKYCAPSGLLFCPEGAAYTQRWVQPIVEGGGSLLQNDNYIAAMSSAYP